MHIGRGLPQVVAEGVGSDREKDCAEPQLLRTTPLSPPPADEHSQWNILARRATWNATRNPAPVRAKDHRPHETPVRQGTCRGRPHTVWARNTLPPYLSSLGPTPTGHTSFANGKPPLREEGARLGSRGGRVARRHGTCGVAAHGRATQPRAPTPPTPRTVWNGQALGPLGTGR